MDNVRVEVCNALHNAGAEPKRHGEALIQRESEAAARHTTHTVQAHITWPCATNRGTEVGQVLIHAVCK